MKQSPEYAKIQRRMQPGVLTLPGFLGTDTRNLADIIAADAQSLAHLGLTADCIAERLRSLTELGRDLMEQERIVEKHFRITVRDDRGVLPSPFGDGLFEKGETSLFDLDTKTEFHWNPLTLHMLQCHGFFGGLGSRYRLTPELVARVLSLQKTAKQS